ncbi:MAG: histidine phosphatase family protein [Dehalococcoidia bacterium]|nr:histidine phosphatase family protein [Dehalococcoidia bacterium]
MKRLYLVRHGESEWNAEERSQGHAPVGLSAKGRRQAARLAERFATLPLTAIWSSDLPRAAQTAEPLAARVGLPIRWDERLRERDSGVMRGLLYAEIRQRFPRHSTRAWLHGEEGALGEPFAEFRVKVERAVADLLSAEDEQIAVITHGGALRVMVAALLGASPVTLWSRLAFDNASVTTFDVRDGAPVLVGFNDRSFLPEEIR